MRRCITLYLLVVAFGFVGASLAAESQDDQRLIEQKGDVSASNLQESIKARDGVPKVARAPTPAPAPPKAAQLLKSLNNARDKGNRAASHAIQAQLDQVYGVVSQPAPLPTVEPQVVFTDSASIEPWLYGDILATTYEPNETEYKPAMTRGADGNFYMAVETADAEIRVYRSLDQGASWEWLIYWGMGSRNPSIVYSGGWVYVIHEGQLTDTTRTIRVMRFEAANYMNITWSTVATNITVPTGVHLHPEICTDFLQYPGDPWLYVTYEVFAIDSYPTLFSRSLDDGLTWSTPVNVHGSAENSNWQTRPDIAYGTYNGLYIAFEKLGWNGVSWTNQVWVTKSSDLGASWSAPFQLTATTPPHYHPRVAAQNGGTAAVVAYTVEYSTDTDINYAYTLNGGTNWTLHMALPYLTTESESEVELSVSNTASGRFHAAFWRGYDIEYTWASVATPGSWAAVARVNEENYASASYRKPTVCVNPSKSVDQEGCVAWSDYRSAYYTASPWYDVYFDAVYAVDTTPPNPNPMTWATEPSELSTTSLGMVASTATDPTPTVLYLFDFVTSPTGGTGGADSAWQSSTSYTNSGLGVNHQYGYQVMAKDGVGNVTTPSVVSYDYTAIETPSGISFGTITTTSIEAKSASTPSGLTRGSSGLLVENLTRATSSGWKQNNDLWLSSGLSPNAAYSFRATARNGDGAQTPSCTAVTRYTLANAPSAAAWLCWGVPILQLNWGANGNPAGTQYFCENQTTGANSGWTTSLTWMDSGLASGTTYTYRVKARNGNGLETTWVSLGTFSM